MSIAVLLTVFNRKNVTLHGLETLYKSIACMSEAYRFDVYMVDDGCTDGTSDAVAQMFPQVRIIREKGGLYWGGGMNEAWKAATEAGNYDYYLWLNDDAELYPHAVASLFEVENQSDGDIIVSGVFEDSEHNISYGGKTATKGLLPPGTTQDIVYMNGNLVLIPQKVFEKIGYIDSWFLHGGGDYDYGLRAKKAGFKLKLTNNIVGVTSRHDKKANYNGAIPLLERIKILYNKKNNPFVASRLYLRHFGLRHAISIFVKRNMKTIFPQQSYTD